LGSASAPLGRQVAGVRKFYIGAYICLTRFIQIVESSLFTSLGMFDARALLPYQGLVFATSLFTFEGCYSREVAHGKP
jgi:hypothetical protein